MRTINNELIEEVNLKTDLITLIGEDVELHKKGNGFVGLCPFHDDHNASMVVTPEKHIYKCFSCGEGGNALTYMQKKRQLSFVDAVVELANRLNIEVSTGPVIKKSALHYINEDAKTYYNTILNTHKDASKARQYLLERGYDQELIDTFEIGYAPSEKFLLKYLEKRMEKNQNYSLLDVQDANLVNEDYEFFSNRLIIPIKDFDGRYVGFSGRVIEGEGTKYLNSKDSKVFSKRQVLYNLDRAKKYITDGTIYIVEGFFDVYALSKSGYNNSIALMGTAFGLEHIKLLKRAKVKKVILLLDQDQAGIASTIKVGELLLKNLTKDVKVVKFDEYKDVDELIKSKKNISNELKLAISFIEFKIENLKQNMPITTLFEKAEFVKVISPELALVDENLKMFIYNDLAKFLSISVDEIKNLTTNGAPKIEIHSSDTISEEYGTQQTYESPKNYHQEVSYIEPKQKNLTNKFSASDEEAAISFSMQSREYFKKVLFGYESGNIQFNTYKKLFMLIREYYKENDKFDLVEFIDNPEAIIYYEEITRIGKIRFDHSRIDELINKNNKNNPPGLWIVKNSKRNS